MPGDSYVFKRDYRARARLNLQHYNWNDTVGYLIHPKIDLRKEEVNVLDIACGTGIWLNHVARSLPPNASLIGTDINIIQCPPKAWRPSNISFHVWDIFQDPPEDFPRFDLIHVQLLNFVIKDNDALAAVLSRAIKLLKPGGWIQWGEYDHPHNVIVKARPDAPSENFEEMINRVRASADSLPTWVEHLDKTFRQQGLLQVEKSSYPVPMEGLPSVTDSIFMGCEEMVAKLDDRDEANELKNIIANAEVESQQGLAWTGPRVVVIGRKEGGR